MAVTTVVIDAAGRAARSTASPPATCGAAMLRFGDGAEGVGILSISLLWHQWVAKAMQLTAASVAECAVCACTPPKPRAPGAAEGVAAGCDLGTRREDVQPRHDCKGGRGGGVFQSKSARAEPAAAAAAAAA